MPQGSWLGPLSFIVLIDDLMAGHTLYKYVDDTTLSESLSSTSQVSDISSVCFLRLPKIPWRLITPRPKKCFWVHFQSLVFLLWSLITIQSNAYAGFKLFGVYISHDIFWNLHVDYICARANARLYYLKRLKRVCLPLYWRTCYLVFLRHQTSSEYCAVVLHHGLRKYQSEVIEAIQRRAIRIIFQWQRLCHTGWHCSMLSFRLFQIGATNFAVIFFCKLLNPSNCIHHLLPPTRDTEITSRLRKATTYPRPRNRTNCYKSFIHHALIKYQ